MTISSSLNSSVSGLAANAARLAALSDNIANSSTYGYKRIETDFHSMVLEGHSNGKYSAGGVRTTNERLIDERGPLVSTSNPTDIAVRGSGLIPVTTRNAVDVDNGFEPFRLTTTGSFRPDDEGYLVTSSGLMLMGWPALPDGTVPTYPRDTADSLEPVRITSNHSAGEATTHVDLVVNLPATSTETGAAGAVEQLSVEYFDNLGKSEDLLLEFAPTVPAAGASNTWTLKVKDSASGGAVVGEYTLQFDDSRALGGTLQSVTAVSGGAYDATTGNVALTLNGGPLDLRIGTLGSSSGLTQLSDNFQPVSISKNGTIVGNMTSIQVDQSGFVKAAFDNGITRTIYQIPLVDVASVNQLEVLDDQSYRISTESGSFFMWDAGDGPTGEIAGYAREGSATDVAEELTDLIQTQRAYSSNAKVIQTVDEMLQETTNIKR